jgi:hypothetical protein
VAYQGKCDLERGRHEDWKTEPNNRRGPDPTGSLHFNGIRCVPAVVCTHGARYNNGAIETKNSHGSKTRASRQPERHTRYCQ